MINIYLPQIVPNLHRSEYFSLFGVIANRFITSIYYLAYDTIKINSVSSTLRNRPC